MIMPGFHLPEDDGGEYAPLLPLPRLGVGEGEVKLLDDIATMVGIWYFIDILVPRDSC